MPYLRIGNPEKSGILTTPFLIPQYHSQIVAALLVIALASVNAQFWGYGLGGLSIGRAIDIVPRAIDISPKAAIGPNILYGGYTLTSHSVSGPCKFCGYISRI